jgi:hypothetical protein
MTDTQKADIAKKKAEVVKIDVDCGLIPFVALAKGRSNQLIEDGTYPGFEAALEEELAKQDFAEREEEAIIKEEEAAKQAAEIAKAGKEEEDPEKENPPPKKPVKEKVPAE